MSKTRNSVLENRKRIKKLTFLALMTALVIVLQFLSTYVKFGTFSITLALTPVVLGAIVCGIGGGLWLGSVFGAMCLLDAALFLGVSVPITVCVCVAKGAVAGLMSALVYKLISRYNKTVATIGAAIICPIANTGVFFIGCHLFFIDKLKEIMGSGYNNVYAFIVFGIIGVNFVVEFLVNSVLSPAILKLINIFEKNKRTK